MAWKTMRSCSKLPTGAKLLLRSFCAARFAWGTLAFAIYIGLCAFRERFWTGILAMMVATPVQWALSLVVSKWLAAGRIRPWWLANPKTYRCSKKEELGWCLIFLATFCVAIRTGAFTIP